MRVARERYAQEESHRPYDLVDRNTKFTNMLLVSILRQEQCYKSHHLTKMQHCNQVRQHSLRNTTC